MKTQNIIYQNINEELMLPRGGPRIVSCDHAIFFDMHELVIRRIGQHDGSFDVIQHIIENAHTDSHLFALFALVRHLDVDKEWQHTHVLYKN